MRKSILVVCCIVLMCLPISSVQADHIIIASDLWCPFNCDPDADQPGYMVEIAQQVFAKAGHTVEYQMLPWARALRECRDGNISGVIGAYVEDAPDFIFPANELAMIGFSMFTTTESSWTYTDITSLQNVALGVIMDYAYSEEIDTYIEQYKDDHTKIQVASGTNPLNQNIGKLLKQRLGATIETDPVFWYTANQMDVKAQLRHAGVVVEPTQAYIAFSPALPKSLEYAQILSDGVEMLRKSGELQKILSKYGLQDWK